MLRSDRQRWGGVAKTFHWGIAALIVIQIGLGLTIVNLPRRPDVMPLFDLHKSVGLSILLLAALRLIWRVFDAHPSRPADVSPVHYRIGRATHVVLYALLFLVPLSGWLFDSATALRPLYWWGLGPLPSLTGGPLPNWAEEARSLHHALVWLLVVVAIGHTFAALIHHSFYRDDILRRMTPWCRPRARERAP